MQISSAASAYIQPATPTATKAESRVEENRSDGDNDKDDASQVTAPQASSPATTGNTSIGSNIDVTA